MRLLRSSAGRSAAKKMVVKKTGGTPPTIELLPVAPCPSSLASSAGPQTLDGEIDDRHRRMLARPIVECTMSHTLSAPGRCQATRGEHPSEAQPKWIPIRA